jgi:site-specific DNA-cytosine methylase
VRGNKRERMAQYGNAVTPPVTQLLARRLFEVLGGGFTFIDLFCGAGGSSIGATQAGGELVLGLNHWRARSRRTRRTSRTPTTTAPTCRR